MYKLEKKVILYKNQFEKFTSEVFPERSLDRLSIELDSLLFRIKYMVKHNKDLDKIPDLKEQFTGKAYELRKMFGEIMYEFLIQIITIPAPYKLEDIHDILAQDVKIDSVNVSFTMILLSDNKSYLEYVDAAIPEDEVFNMFPDEFFRIYTDSYNDGIAKAFPELFENRHQDKIGTGADGDVYCHNFTFQTSERCSLNCTYCYQFNKSDMRMDFDTAKEFIDKLLNDEYGYINRYNSPAIIIEFIGGEPLMEIALTRQIYEYFLDRCYDLDHPWFMLHRLSICSNGLQYFDDDVQDFFKEYHQNISFNISIDGNKELHDSCRIQPNGEGSYDISMAALNHFNSHFSSERNSKMTLAPANIKYLFDSVVDFINHGMTSINLNCVFEEGWNQETAKTEYEQLKKLADYLLDNDLEHLYIAIFNEKQEDMQPKSSDGNFCFFKDTAVSTPFGSKMITDLEVGDFVYTASGSINMVQKQNSYESDNNRTLKVKGAFPIHCTDDHKFYAKKLSPGLFNGRPVMYSTSPEFYPINELHTGDMVALPYLQINDRPSPLGENMAYLLGAYLADGDTGHPVSKVTIHVHEGMQDAINDALAKTMLVYSSRDENGVRCIDINEYHCAFNTMFVKLCWQCGSGIEYCAHFPEAIFDAGIDVVKSFMKGFIDVKGELIRDKGFGLGLMKVTVKSHLLANDFLLFLRSIGEYPFECIHRPTTFIDVEGITKHVDDRYEIYWDTDKKHFGTGFDLDPEFPVIWAPIESIEEDHTRHRVYCPTLIPYCSRDDEHTFIAEGVATKNCGGLGSMLAMRPNGQFYPCIRYMPTSVGDNVEDLCIGTVKDGLVGREQGSKVLEMMDKITRRSQSNDICYECPLSNDCAWCSALSHAVYGTPGKRPMFICIQMIAEALANVYYWNLLNIKHPEYRLGVRKNVVPDEWALLVIEQDELDYLKKLESYSMITTLEKEAQDS